MSMDKICVIGLWHQGVVGAACLADLGCDVIAADQNEQTVRLLQSGKAPLFEPGLDELLQKTIHSGRLRFTSNLRAAVKGHAFVMIMFDTPVDENDQSDLNGIFAAAKEIAPVLENDCVILVTAQAPVGTCDLLEAEIKKINPSLRFAIAYSPENLQLGRAIERFRNPPMRVIGSDNSHAFDRLESFLAKLGGKWERVPLRTAEMVKHALNGYLAVSLTYGNELGNLCDKVGADGRRVAEILRTEPRVGGKAMLFPGLGFSGGTLARDMQTLRNLGRKFSVATPLLDGAWQSNDLQNHIIVSKLRQVFSTSGCARGAKSLEGKKIAVLGLTYKPDTSTLRRSISLAIIGELVNAKALVTAHDPRADRAEIYHALGVIAGQREFRFEEDVYQAAKGADVLLLITGWKEYKDLNYGEIRKLMDGNLLIDANNLLNRADIEQLGFKYIGIGRGYDLNKINEKDNLS